MNTNKRKDEFEDKIATNVLELQEIRVTSLCITYTAWLHENAGIGNTKAIVAHRH